MKLSFLSCLSAAAMLSLPLSAAHADLILAGPNPIGGTGLGAVNTILTIQGQGNATTEAGCVSFGGFTGTSFSGGLCVGSSGDVKTGASQTQTRTLLETGVTSAANFGIIFNASEPGGNEITLESLNVVFFSSTGTVLFQASTVESFFFPTSNTGTGNSGFLFVLDAAQQASATAAGAFNSSSNVIGLSASASQATGGNETFFVANTGRMDPVDPVVVVPEPSTLALLSAGLMGMFGFARARRRA